MKLRVPNRLRGDHAAQLAYFTRVLSNGCWEFTGYVLPDGYGQLGRNIGAHRLAWEIAHGRPVPAGLVIDHQCHNLDPTCSGIDGDCAHRRCVNPDHLEAVPSAVNVLRGKGFASANQAVTHCPEGHEYSPSNTYYRPDRPGRLCRICRYEAGRRSAAAHREENRLRALADRRKSNPEGYAIREWAARNGLPCAAFGPISRTVLAAYDAAHTKAAA